MADRATNEYLNSERAQNDPNDLFAALGKQVLGLSVKDGDVVPEDDRVKVVDQVESLCMNCEENVGHQCHPAAGPHADFGRERLDYFLLRYLSSAKSF